MPVKYKRKRTQENRNKQGDKRHITRVRFCKICKHPLTEFYDQVKKMQNLQMSEQIAIAAKEGIRKQGKPCKRERGCRGFKCNGDKNRQAILETLGNRGALYLLEA
jgi:hypothetical protein